MNGNFYSPWLVKAICNNVSRETRREVDEKNDKKWHWQGVPTKNWCHSPEIFLFLFYIKFIFSFSVFQEALTILRLATIKTHPRHYNSTILPTWFINLCVFVCKNVSAHRLKLQSQTISTFLIKGNRFKQPPTQKVFCFMP